MRIRSLSTLLLIVLLSMFLFAQRPGSRPPNAPSNATAAPSMMKNNTEIQVRVSGENERPVNDVLRVQLIRAANVPIAETFTNQEGMAEFRNQQLCQFAAAANLLENQSAGSN